ncbi:hypothetical protein AGMMS4952_09320 [Spirochaetia bacterium]|nr:hypothetical protein AGMMS4952_09320 [Spirochaetia bacterium]
MPINDITESEKTKMGTIGRVLFSNNLITTGRHIKIDSLIIVAMYIILPIFRLANKKKMENNATRTIKPTSAQPIIRSCHIGAINGLLTRYSPNTITSERTDGI